MKVNWNLTAHRTGWAWVEHISFLFFLFKTAAKKKSHVASCWMWIVHVGTYEVYYEIDFQLPWKSQRNQLLCIMNNSHFNHQHMLNINVYLWFGKSLSSLKLTRSSEPGESMECCLLCNYECVHRNILFRITDWSDDGLYVEILP